MGVPARRPPHPGQFLESRFLKPLHISQTELAEALGVSRRRVNELINGRRAITPDTAVRLAMYYLLIFAVIHMYMAIREDVMGGEIVVGSMVNGLRSFKEGANKH